MNWLIDSDVLIDGEREHPGFVPWLTAQSEVATADVGRAEYLVGVHAVQDAQKRQRGERFYQHWLKGIASLPCELSDYETGARLAGEARRNGRGNPSLVDGLLAAIAFRKGAKVATKNLKDFKAMNCPCDNPLEQLPTQAAN
ncbi:MAG: type II toxin-antitoxin system VapC family toxin [Verrucomicrobia bacterium]|nr:type II toxin-antitoxin system VapC family toxin [Verrucomicrobiota bacterium]